jgi:hypothetical protein
VLITARVSGPKKPVAGKLWADWNFFRTLLVFVPKVVVSWPGEPGPVAATGKQRELFLALLLLRYKLSRSNYQLQEGFLSMWARSSQVGVRVAVCGTLGGASGWVVGLLFPLLNEPPGRLTLLSLVAGCIIGAASSRGLPRLR